MNNEGQATKLAAEASALIVKGFILYAVALPAGFALGGIIGGSLSAYYALDGWLIGGSIIAGLFIGTVSGFFLAQIFVMGMIEDLALKYGLKMASYSLGRLKDEIRKIRGKPLKTK